MCGRRRARHRRARIARDPRAWLAAGLLLTAGALLGSTATSWFFADDFLNFAIARQKGLSLDLLRTSYFQHFAPMHRVLDYLIQGPLDLSWDGGRAVMLAIWLAGVGGVWIVMRELRVPTALAATVTFMFASSPVWARLLQWWAAGGHVIPGLAGTAVALGCALRWHRTRSPPMLLGVAAAYVFALAAYSKPLLVVGYIALTLWFVLAPSLRPQALLRHVARDWPLIVVLSLVSVGYLMIIRMGGYDEGSQLAPLVTWEQYLRLCWTRGVTPLLLGQWVPEHSDTLRNEVAVVAAQAALALAIATSIALRASAWRAWVAYGLMWIANVALIGYARLVQFGPGIGHDMRYEAEFALVIALTLALAFGPLEADGSPGRPLAAAFAARALRLTATARARRWPLPAAAALACLLWAGSVVSSYRQVNEQWVGNKSHAWAEQVRRTTEAIRRSGREPTLLDAAAPFDVVAGLGPNNNLGSVLGVIAPDILVNSARPAAVPSVVEPDGTVRKLRLDLVSASSAAALERREQLTVTGAMSRTGAGGAVCVDAAADAAALVEWPVPPVARGRGLLVAADVRGDGPGSQVLVFLDTAGAYAGPVSDFAITPSRGVLRIYPPGDALRKLRLDVQPGGSLCVSRLSLYRIR